MVKPPKTMQPEAIGNLEKAGRSSTKSFGQDSFHNYMARKISLQRQQFGLKLPPPPPPEHAEWVKDKPKATRPPPKSPPSLIRNKRSSRLSEEGTNGKTHNKSPSPMRVRFAPDSKPAASESQTLANGKSRKRNRLDRKGKTYKLLKRLKRRHGKRSSCSSQEESCSSQSEDSTVGPQQESRVVEIIHNGRDDEADKAKARDLPDHIERDDTTNQTGSNAVSDYSATRKPVQSKKPHIREDLFFSGVVVIVNGDTNPDTETIQRILHRHGGDLEKYETSRITHIVAEHLSFAKAKMYKAQRKPRPVVYPSWITDSVKAQRQLPFSEYLIKEFRRDDERSQPSLQAFFQAPKNPPVAALASAAAHTPESCDSRFETKKFNTTIP